MALHRPPPQQEDEPPGTLRALLLVVGLMALMAFSIAVVFLGIDDHACASCGFADRGDPAEWAGKGITPGGFALSNLIFLIPMVVGFYWAFTTHHVRHRRGVLVRSTILLGIISVVVDVGFLGATLFSFPNEAASWPRWLQVPMLDWIEFRWETHPHPDIVLMPWEDLAFYLIAAALVLVMYHFLTLDWMARSSADWRPDASGRTVAEVVQSGVVVPCWHGRTFIEGHPRKPERWWPSFKLHFFDSWREPVGRNVAFAFVGLSVGLLIWGFAAQPKGSLPLYALYLTLSTAVASYLMLGQVWKHVNWRAFTLTAAVMTLLSVVYEITMALPFGWWGFEERALLGLRVDALWDIPVEQLFLYVSGSFTIVLLYETVLVWDAWKHDRPQPTPVVIRDRDPA